MKEMTFYRDNDGYTYSKINGKIFCFDKNKFIDCVNKDVKQYGDSLLKEFNPIVSLAKVKNENINFNEREIEEAKIIFMKSYFYINMFGR